MSLDYYNAQEKCWVSPRLVLVYYDELLKTYGDKVLTSREFKKVIEAKVVAIALLGINKFTRLHFMMQVPKAINDSPDIVTMNLVESDDKPVHMNLQDVEVVEYSERESLDLGTFLINTKLSPKLAKKAYDDKTIILCNITKNNVHINHKKVHDEIREIKPKPAVYLIGPIPKPNKTFVLTRIWPELDKSIEIDVVNDGNNYSKPDSCKFSLGTNKKVVFGKSPLPLPSKREVFELSENI